MQGWRVSMEDAHIAIADMHKDPPMGIFAVFDGHGGGDVAKFCAHHLVGELMKTPEWKEFKLDQALCAAYLKLDDLLDSDAGHAELRAIAGNKNKKGGLFDHVAVQDKDKEKGKTTSRRASTESRRSAADPASTPTGLVETPSETFTASALSRHSIDLPSGLVEKTDTTAAAATTTSSEDGEEDQRHKAAGMGCTALTALVCSDRVFVANTGDSRCVLSKSGQAKALSIDHKPNLPLETDRITKAGGFIKDNRVNGALNVSRTLGDLDFKRNADLGKHEQMVIAYPDVEEVQLDDDVEFLILACDGIWDVLDDQGAVDFVRKRLKMGQNLKNICEEMCDQCLAKDLKGLCKGADNMSVIVVHLKHNGGISRTMWSRISSGTRRLFGSSK
jgi:protein phosphatase 1G